MWCSSEVIVVISTCRGSGNLVGAILRKGYIPSQSHPVYFRQLSGLSTSNTEGAKIKRYPASVAYVRVGLE